MRKGGGMKVIVAVMFVLLIFSGGVSMAETRLQRVEQLTSEEVEALKMASGEVAKARKHLEEVEGGIAKAHDMRPEEYMEWKTWYVLDGSYILLYFRGWND